MASEDEAALYRTTFTDSPVGMSVATPDGRVLAVDRALCELLDHPVAQLLIGDGREVPFPAFRWSTATGMEGPRLPRRSCAT